MVFFIPGTDSKIFQGARRVFTFHIEIFSLLSEPTANSVMKRSKCEKWKLFKPLEKFKRKGLGWVICFLRLIEVYLYAIIISTYQEKLTESCKMGPQDPRSQKTDLLLIISCISIFCLFHFEYILHHFANRIASFFEFCRFQQCVSLVTAFDLVVFLLDCVLAVYIIRVTEVCNFLQKLTNFVTCLAFRENFWRFLSQLYR